MRQRLEMQQQFHRKKVNLKNKAIKKCHKIYEKKSKRDG